MRTVTGAVAWLVLSTTLAVAQEPAYSFGTGPAVLIDAAHHNLIDIVESHGTWLEEEGFRVRILRQPFDHESLVGADVVITATPSAPRNAVTRPWTEEKFARAWQPPFPSAFTAGEISALREWVTEGGGLVLIFDHMPVSNAVEELAAAFGVEVANGHAYDARMLRWEGDSLSKKEAGAAVFRRIDGTLAAHRITDGRSVSERIDSVALGGGAAFRLPPDGRPLLALGTWFVSLLPEAPFRFRKDTPRQPIGGWSQGGVLRVGRGRLAVFSDAGILATHDEVAVQEPPWNGWQLQNPRLLLNTLHWLSGLLDGFE
jgi:hypothetical protein